MIRALVAVTAGAAVGSLLLAAVGYFLLPRLEDTGW